MVKIENDLTNQNYRIVCVCACECESTYISTKNKMSKLTDETQKTYHSRILTMLVQKEGSSLLAQEFPLYRHIRYSLTLKGNCKR